MNIKSLSRRLAIALAVAGGLAIANLVQAQDVYSLVNFYPVWGNHSSLYGNWADWPANPSEVNMNWDYTGDITNSGLEVISTVGGYGSGYADLNNSVGVTFANGDLALATNDTLCILSFTVNPTPGMAASGSTFYTNYNWIGIQFFPQCDSGPTDFQPAYFGGWNNPGNSNNVVFSGSNATVTINMAALTHPSTIGSFSGTYGQAFTTFTQGGTNHFYGCNIGVNPAVIWNDPKGTNGLPFDITFTSITFTAPPTTPPNPSITTVGPNVVISWPDPNNIFTLYQSANMAQFSWAPWGFAPVYANGTNTVTIPPPFNQALYFRLANTTLQ